MLLPYGVIGFFNGVVLIFVFDVYYGNKELLGALPTTAFDWFIILTIGVLTYIGPASLTIALQIESAGLLALIRKAFSIMFAYTFQITIFEVSQPITTDILVVIRDFRYTCNSLPNQILLTIVLCLAGNTK